MNLDLGNLSEDEQDIIWNVMLRYEEFRRRDEQRVSRLKSELQLLRKRGALRPGIDPERSCARCRITLGHIINTGAICRACKLKICKTCREYSRSGKYWICTVCYKQLQINAASGEWFYGGHQKAGDKGYLPLTQLVRRSIRQARKDGSHKYFRSSKRTDRGASGGINALPKTHTVLYLATTTNSGDSSGSSSGNLSSPDGEGSYSSLASPNSPNQSSAFGTAASFNFSNISKNNHSVHTQTDNHNFSYSHSFDKACGKLPEVKKRRLGSKLPSKCYHTNSKTKHKLRDGRDSSWGDLYISHDNTNGKQQLLEDWRRIHFPEMTAECSDISHIYDLDTIPVSRQSFLTHSKPYSQLNAFSGNTEPINLSSLVDQKYDCIDCKLPYSDSKVSVAEASTQFDFRDLTSKLPNVDEIAIMKLITDIKAQKRFTELSDVPTTPLIVTQSALSSTDIVQEKFDHEQTNSQNSNFLNISSCKNDVSCDSILKSSNNISENSVSIGINTDLLDDVQSQQLEMGFQNIESSKKKIILDFLHHKKELSSEDTFEIIQIEQFIVDIFDGNILLAEQVLGTDIIRQFKEHIAENVPKPYFSSIPTSVEKTELNFFPDNSQMTASNHYSPKEEQKTYNLSADNCELEMPNNLMSDLHIQKKEVSTQSSPYLRIKLKRSKQLNNHKDEIAAKKCHISDKDDSNNTLIRNDKTSEELLLNNSLFYNEASENVFKDNFDQSDINNREFQNQIAHELVRSCIHQSEQYFVKEEITSNIKSKLEQQKVEAESLVNKSDDKENDKFTLISLEPQIIVKTDEVKVFNSSNLENDKDKESMNLLLTNADVCSFTKISECSIKNILPSLCESVDNTEHTRLFQTVLNSSLENEQIILKDDDARKETTLDKIYLHSSPTFDFHEHSFDLNIDNNSLGDSEKNEFKTVITDLSRERCKTIFLNEDELSKSESSSDDDKATCDAILNKLNSSADTTIASEILNDLEDSDDTLCEQDNVSPVCMSSSFNNISSPQSVDVSVMIIPTVSGFMIKDEENLSYCKNNSTSESISENKKLDVLSEINFPQQIKKVEFVSEPIDSLNHNLCSTFGNEMQGCELHPIIISEDDFSDSSDSVEKPEYVFENASQLPDISSFSKHLEHSSDLIIQCESESDLEVQDILANSKKSGTPYEFCKVWTSDTEEDFLDHASTDDINDGKDISALESYLDESLREFNENDSNLLDNTVICFDNDNRLFTNLSSDNTVKSLYDKQIVNPNSKFEETLTLQNSESPIPSDSSFEEVDMKAHRNKSKSHFYCFNEEDNEKNSFSKLKNIFSDSTSEQDINDSDNETESSSTTSSSTSSESSEEIHNKPILMNSLKSKGVTLISFDDDLYSDKLDPISEESGESSSSIIDQQLIEINSKIDYELKPIEEEQVFRLEKYSTLMSNAKPSKTFKDDIRTIMIYPHSLEKNDNVKSDTEYHLEKDSQLDISNHLLDNKSSNSHINSKLNPPRSNFYTSTTENVQKIPKILEDCNEWSDHDIPLKGNTKMSSSEEEEIDLMQQNLISKIKSVDEIESQAKQSTVILLNYKENIEENYFKDDLWENKTYDKSKNCSVITNNKKDQTLIKMEAMEGDLNNLSTKLDLVQSAAKKASVGEGDWVLNQKKQEIEMMIATKFKDLVESEDIETSGLIASYDKDNAMSDKNILFFSKSNYDQQIDYEEDSHIFIDRNKFFNNDNIPIKAFDNNYSDRESNSSSDTLKDSPKVTFGSKEIYIYDQNGVYTYEKVDLSLDDDIYSEESDAESLEFSSAYQDSDVNLPSRWNNESTLNSASESLHTSFFIPPEPEIDYTDDDDDVVYKSQPLPIEDRDFIAESVCARQAFSFDKPLLEETTFHKLLCLPNENLDSLNNDKESKLKETDDSKENISTNKIKNDEIQLKPVEKSLLINEEKRDEDDVSFTEAENEKIVINTHEFNIDTTQSLPETCTCDQTDVINEANNKLISKMNDFKEGKQTIKEIEKGEMQGAVSEGERHLVEKDSYANVECESITTHEALEYAIHHILFDDNTSFKEEIVDNNLDNSENNKSSDFEMGNNSNLTGLVNISQNEQSQFEIILPSENLLNKASLNTHEGFIDNEVLINVNGHSLQKNNTNNKVLYSNLLSMSNPIHIEIEKTIADTLQKVSESAILVNQTIEAITEENKLYMESSVNKNLFCEIIEAEHLQNVTEKIPQNVEPVTPLILNKVINEKDSISSTSESDPFLSQSCDIAGSYDLSDDVFASEATLEKLLQGSFSNKNFIDQLPEQGSTIPSLVLLVARKIEEILNINIIPIEVESNKTKEIKIAENEDDIFLSNVANEVCIKTKDINNTISSCNNLNIVNETVNSKLTPEFLSDKQVKSDANTFESITYVSDWILVDKETLDNQNDSDESEIPNLSSQSQSDMLEKILEPFLDDFVIVDSITDSNITEKDCKNNTISHLNPHTSNLTLPSTSDNIYDTSYFSDFQEYKNDSKISYSNDYNPLIPNSDEPPVETLLHQAADIAIATSIPSSLTAEEYYVKIGRKWQRMSLAEVTELVPLESMEIWTEIPLEDSDDFSSLNNSLYDQNESDLNEFISIQELVKQATKIAVVPITQNITPSMHNSALKSGLKSAAKVATSPIILDDATNICNPILKFPDNQFYNANKKYMLSSPVDILNHIHVPKLPEVNQDFIPSNINKGNDIFYKDEITNNSEKVRHINGNEKVFVNENIEKDDKKRLHEENNINLSESNILKNNISSVHKIAKTMSKAVIKEATEAIKNEIYLASCHSVKTYDELQSELSFKSQYSDCKNNSTHAENARNKELEDNSLTIFSDKFDIYKQMGDKIQEAPFSEKINEESNKNLASSVLSSKKYFSLEIDNQNNHDAQKLISNSLWNEATSFLTCPLTKDGLQKLDIISCEKSFNNNDTNSVLLEQKQMFVENNISHHLENQNLFQLFEKENNFIQESFSTFEEIPNHNQLLMKKLNGSDHNSVKIMLDENNLDKTSQKLIPSRTEKHCEEDIDFTIPDKEMSTSIFFQPLSDSFEESSIQLSRRKILSQIKLELIPKGHVIRVSDDDITFLPLNTHSPFRLPSISESDEKQPVDEIEKEPSTSLVKEMSLSDIIDSASDNSSEESDQFIQSNHPEFLDNDNEVFNELPESILSSPKLKIALQQLGINPSDSNFDDYSVKGNTTNLDTKIRDLSCPQESVKNRDNSAIMYNSNNDDIEKEKRKHEVFDSKIIMTKSLGEIEIFSHIESFSIDSPYFLNRNENESTFNLQQKVMNNNFLKYSDTFIEDKKVILSKSLGEIEVLLYGDSEKDKQNREKHYSLAHEDVDLPSTFQNTPNVDYNLFKIGENECKEGVSNSLSEFDMFNKNIHLSDTNKDIVKSILPLNQEDVCTFKDYIYSDDILQHKYCILEDENESDQKKGLLYDSNREETLNSDEQFLNPLAPVKVHTVQKELKIQPYFENISSLQSTSCLSLFPTQITEIKTLTNKPAATSILSTTLPEKFNESLCCETGEEIILDNTHLKLSEKMYPEEILENKDINFNNLLTSDAKSDQVELYLPCNDQLLIENKIYTSHYSYPRLFTLQTDLPYNNFKTLSNSNTIISLESEEKPTSTLLPPLYKNVIEFHFDISDSEFIDNISKNSSQNEPKILSKNSNDVEEEIIPILIDSEAKKTIKSLSTFVKSFDHKQNIRKRPHLKTKIMKLNDEDFETFMFHEKEGFMKEIKQEPVFYEKKQDVTEPFITPTKITRISGTDHISECLILENKISAGSAFENLQQSDKVCEIAELDIIDSHGLSKPNIFINSFSESLEPEPAGLTIENLQQLDPGCNTSELYSIDSHCLSKSDCFNNSFPVKATVEAITIPYHILNVDQSTTSVAVIPQKPKLLTTKHDLSLELEIASLNLVDQILGENMNLLENLSESEIQNKISSEGHSNPFTISPSIINNNNKDLAYNVGILPKTIDLLLEEDINSEANKDFIEKPELKENQEMKNERNFINSFSNLNPLSVTNQHSLVLFENAKNSSYTLSNNQHKSNYVTSFFVNSSSPQLLSIPKSEIDYFSSLKSLPDNNQKIVQINEKSSIKSDSNFCSKEFSIPPPMFNILDSTVASQMPTLSSAMNDFVTTISIDLNSSSQFKNSLRNISENLPERSSAQEENCCGNVIVNDYNIKDDVQQTASTIDDKKLENANSYSESRKFFINEFEDNNFISGSTLNLEQSFLDQSASSEEEQLYEDTWGVYGLNTGERKKIKKRFHFQESEGSEISSSSFLTSNGSIITHTSSEMQIMKSEVKKITHRLNLPISSSDENTSSDDTLTPTDDHSIFDASEYSFSSSFNNSTSKDLEMPLKKTVENNLKKKPHSFYSTPSHETKKFLKYSDDPFMLLDSKSFSSDEEISTASSYEPSRLYETTSDISLSESKDCLKLTVRFDSETDSVCSLSSSSDLYMSDKKQKRSLKFLSQSILENDQEMFQKMKPDFDCITDQSALHEILPSDHSSSFFTKQENSAGNISPDSPSEKQNITIKKKECLSPMSDTTDKELISIEEAMKYLKMEKNNFSSQDNPEIDTDSQVLNELIVSRPENNRPTLKNSHSFHSTNSASSKILKKSNDNVKKSHSFKSNNSSSKSSFDNLPIFIDVPPQDLNPLEFRVQRNSLFRPIKTEFAKGIEGAKYQAEKQAQDIQMNISNSFQDVLESEIMFTSETETENESEIEKVNSQANELEKVNPQTSEENDAQIMETSSTDKWLSRMSEEFLQIVSKFDNSFPTFSLESISTKLPDKGESYKSDQLSTSHLSDIKSHSSGMSFKEDELLAVIENRLKESFHDAEHVESQGCTEYFSTEDEVSLINHIQNNSNERDGGESSPDLSSRSSTNSVIKLSTHSGFGHLESDAMSKETSQSVSISRNSQKLQTSEDSIDPSKFPSLLKYKTDNLSNPQLFDVALQSFSETFERTKPEKVLVELGCCRNVNTREISIQASDVQRRVNWINSLQDLNKESIPTEPKLNSSLSNNKSSLTFGKKKVPDILNLSDKSSPAYKSEKFINIQPLSPSYTLASPNGETIEFIVEPVNNETIYEINLPSESQQSDHTKNALNISSKKFSTDKISDSLADASLLEVGDSQESNDSSSHDLDIISSGSTTLPKSPIAISSSGLSFDNIDNNMIDLIHSYNVEDAVANTNTIPPSSNSLLATEELTEEIDNFTKTGQEVATDGIPVSSHLSPAVKKSQSSASESLKIPEISVTEPKESNAEKSQDEDLDVFSEEDFDKMFSPVNRKQSSTTGSRESMSLSLYSNAGEGYGKIIISGEVMFGVSYNYRTRSLDILIKQCRDLAAVDPKKNRSDPYVKTYLLPDKSKVGKRKTKVKKNSLNPIFDETLKYSITASELQSRTLWVSVWHNDTFGRNNFLGEVHACLSNETLRDSTPKWYKLQERITSPESPLAYKGDIVVALRYQPPDITTKKKIYNQKGSLHILVKEARNLVAVRGISSDPFCKSYLLPEKGKNSKQKTPVIKRDCSPKWNHTFVFDDITIDDLKDKAVELTIWDHDRLTSNEFLGGIRLGLGTGQALGKPAEWNDARGEEIKIWQTMLNQPNTWVEETLELRSNMDYK